MPLVTDIIKNKNYIDVYDYFVMESDVENKTFLKWIEENKLIIAAEQNNGKKTMFILTKRSLTS